jgi:hypothetical protein
MYAVESQCIDDNTTATAVELNISSTDRDIQAVLVCLVENALS